VAKERPDCFGHRENELPMRQLEQDLVCQLFSEQDGSFATAGRTKIKPFAGKRSEVIVSAFGVGTAYPRDALEIVAARREALAKLLDALKAVSTVGGCVLLVVLLAEVLEVSFEYSVELVAATGNVLIPRRGRDRDCRAHINIYGSNELPASRGGRIHGTPHNIAHSPDAFSSLCIRSSLHCSTSANRSCEGAGDAVVIQHPRQPATLCDN